MVSKLLFRFTDLLTIHMLLPGEANPRKLKCRLEAWHSCKARWIAGQEQQPQTKSKTWPGWIGTERLRDDRQRWLEWSPAQALPTPCIFQVTNTIFFRCFDLLTKLPPQVKLWCESEAHKHLKFFSTWPCKSTIVRFGFNRHLFDPSP